MRKAMLLSFSVFLAVMSSAGRPGQIPPPVFSSNSWQSLGPPGGSVIAIAANPQNANELYAAAGSTTTQVLKSTDGGSTWTRISTINDRVFDFAVNPTNQNIIYALSWSGVYKSTDRGLIWTFVSFPSSSSNYSYGYYGKLGVNRSDGNTIYASGYRYESGNYYMAIFKSTDGGGSWAVQKISPAGSSGAYVYGLAVFPTNPNIVYAGGVYYTSRTTYKVYKTTNGGASWEDVTGSVYLLPYDMAIDPNNSAKVYLGSTGGKFFRTSDGGATWSMNATGYVYAYTVAVDPVNTNILFAGYAKAVYKSTDGGQNWTSYTNGLLGTGNDLFIGPFGSASPFANATTGGGILFASTAGVFRSTDGGTNWQDSSSGISANSAQAVGLCGGSPSKLFAECTGNDFFKTDNYGATWQRCASYNWCDGIKRVLVNPSNANEVVILAGG